MSDEKPKRGRPASGTAKTPAQLQREYRERVKRLASASTTDDRGQGSTRLNMWLPAGAAAGIACMARMNGCTKAAMLTKIIMEAEKAITLSMNDEQLDEYYSLRSNGK